MGDITRCETSFSVIDERIQYIPRNMHTVFALLCFVVVIHWLIFPYPSGLLHWHCGNLTIAPVPAKQAWWIWINTSCEFIMNDCITTTKQSTTKPCANFLGYTVIATQQQPLTTVGRFNIKMPPSQNRKSHVGDKTVARSSYLNNGISYTGKMASLYLIWTQAPPDTTKAMLVSPIFPI